MAYNGKRKPQDDSIEKWTTFFEINPGRKEEFPKEWERVNPKKEEEAPPLKVRKKTKISNKEKVTSKNNEAFKALENMVFWSPLLGGAVTVSTVDTERNSIKIHITKTAYLDFNEFLELPLEHFGGSINNDTGLKKLHLKQINDWESKAIEAFKDFRSQMGDTRTPIHEWIKENFEK